MIGRLKGILLEKQPPEILLDVIVTDDQFL